MADETMLVPRAWYEEVTRRLAELEEAVVTLVEAAAGVDGEASIEAQLDASRAAAAQARSGGRPRLRR